MKRAVYLLATVAVLSAAAPAQLEAQMSTVQVASGLNDPLYVTAPPGDHKRLYIVEQDGAIKIMDMITGNMLPGVFVDLNTAVNSGANERGLLGMAFHPDFATNGYFFVHYTNNNGTSVVRRLTADINDPTTVVAGSSTLIWSATQPASNHNGGMIAFSPTELANNLYIGLGDGGGGGDTYNTSQNLNSPLAKILRIDVDGPAPYGIPADNPSQTGMLTTTVPETWVYGLRNPWRFSFDQLTGDMYIGDVGQGTWEEIDFIAASSPGGINFGWVCREGAHCFGSFPGQCSCTTASLVDPIWEYSHSDGCSITGGEVYRGLAIPALNGHYFYADYCSNKIWSFNYTSGTVSAFAERTAQLDPPGFQSITTITSFGRDAAGEIYICDRGGEIYKMIPIGMVDCNNNHVLDSVEISLGCVPDCDNNGIPDSCDIANGAPDVNQNGIIDTCEAGVEFVRADCNLDLSVNIADPVAALDYLFNMGLATCLDSCDSNDDGSLDISDPIHTLAGLFSMGPAPSAPYPLCGLDPTTDVLDCVTGPSCP
ncbi:MAG: PQQ-dependent sugar dehydrogenase [Planctomycetota bacterium]